jgi:hypothetical protein
MLLQTRATAIITVNFVFWAVTLLFFYSRLLSASDKVFSSLLVDKSKCSQFGKDGLHLPTGKHWLVDFHEADPAALKYLETMKAKDTVASFIAEAGMTLLGSSSHVFPCGGITAVWLLSESHVSIHTWPENK